MTLFRLTRFHNHPTEDSQWGVHNVGQVLIWSFGDKTNVCVSTPAGGWAWLDKEHNPNTLGLREILISRKEVGCSVDDIEVELDTETVKHHVIPIKSWGYVHTKVVKPEPVDPTLYFKNKDYGEF